jgi:hypothetical protein
MWKEFFSISMSHAHTHTIMWNDAFCDSHALIIMRCLFIVNTRCGWACNNMWFVIYKATLDKICLWTRIVHNTSKTSLSIWVVQRTLKEKKQLKVFIHLQLVGWLGTLLGQASTTYIKILECKYQWKDTDVDFMKKLEIMFWLHLWFFLVVNEHDKWKVFCKDNKWICVLYCRGLPMVVKLKKATTRSQGMNHCNILAK